MVQQNYFVELALSLLVLWILADNHYTTVSLDDFALVAHRLNRCSDFHFMSSSLLLLLSPGDPSAGQIIRR